MRVNLHDRTAVMVQEVRNTHRGARWIRLAYFDSAPGSSKPVVVLVHGSPGSGNVMRPLARRIEDHYRVILPDLPGFGASEHSLPDYSFRAHATYLLELLDQLHVDRANLVGFSMGGGVVLSLEQLAPTRMRSLTLLSAIGVQERELTGNYWLNHELHGAQLAILWTLRYLTPHCGLADSMGLSLEYAWNFYESDQRPLRNVLAGYRGPMLILHGDQDANVPLAAAEEHHRLVPQSTLLVLQGNHFMTFQEPWLLAGPLRNFLDGVNEAEHERSHRESVQR